MDAINEVVDRGLCTGCGTCAGVCPNRAINMRLFNSIYVPEIENEKCIHCGICIRSCPGYSTDFTRLNAKIFGKQPENTWIGNFLKCYISHSEDKDIRYHSSSGGLATQILIFALEKRIIDGALVVRMRKNDPLEPEPFIARTKEDVIFASKSKYCPVAANEALEQILAEDGRFAVVGLPCHIHGIRKAEEAIEKLKERIVLHIGLMCSHTVSFNGTEFLLKKLRIKKEHVAKLDYRGEGWPGSMSVQVKDGSNLTIPYVGGWNAYLPVFSCLFFTPMRCIMCSDQTNELADISLGDPWLPELKHEKSGQSIIITRTRTAEDIINLMSSAKAISIKGVDCEKVKQSQAPPLKFKKDNLNARLFLLKSFGKETPKFNLKPNCKSSPITFLQALFPYLNIQASSNKYLRSLMVYVPFPLFRLYYGIFKFLSLT